MHIAPKCFGQSLLSDQPKAVRPAPDRGIRLEFSKSISATSTDVRTGPRAVWRAGQSDPFVDDAGLRAFEHSFSIVMRGRGDSGRMMGLDRWSKRSGEYGD
jgi:hypothetical protein